MHEYRQLIEREMKNRSRYQSRGGQSRLAEDAEIDRQIISRILKDDRDVLGGAPSEKTVAGLARAFELDPDVIWVAVARALGLPSHVVPSITHEVGTLSNEQLLGELAKRFGLAATFRPAPPSTPEDEKIDESLPTYEQLEPLRNSGDGSAPDPKKLGPGQAAEQGKGD